ncbi:NACHT domain-containing protein [Streptomyces sp. NPDC012888]|uniref:NACHT domain-containing protein n=1 Tax=Streptomyces sp. NPDC012888 TaxID=3364855 RepID=UPI0036A7A1B7
MTPGDRQPGEPSPSGPADEQQTAAGTTPAAASPPATGETPGPTFHASGTGNANASHGGVANSGVIGRLTVVQPRRSPKDAQGSPDVPALWELRRRRMAGAIMLGWVTPQLQDARKRLHLVDVPMTLAIAGDRPTPLPPGTPPRDVFERSAQQLLILGEPGAGKSTLMLRLMEDLLRDGDPWTTPLPVPVVVPHDRPAPADMTDWLIPQVTSWFDLRPAEVAALLHFGLLVPCLEGLDAVAEAHMEGWAAAVTGHLRRHREQPMVVASREATAQAMHLDPALTGSLRIQPLTDTLLDEAVASLGDDRHPVQDLLADNPGIREWCTTPLMLAVVAAVDPGDWDAPSHEEVLQFAVTSSDPRHLEAICESAQARQHVREQYAALRHYVDSLLREPAPAPATPLSKTRKTRKTRPLERPVPPVRTLRSDPKLTRGLRGLARAMRYSGQEYFDGVTLLAASDPAEARLLGARTFAPRVRQEIVRDLAIAGIVLSTHAYSMAPGVLLLFGWSLLMLWYTQVYGGVLEAPALRWVGRWTHVLPGQWGAAVRTAALGYVVTFAYAIMTRLPFGTAAVVAAVMAAALLVVGAGAGLAKFRTRGTAADPRRSLLRVLLRGLAAAAVLGPVHAAAAWWCAELAGTKSFSIGPWAGDAAFGALYVFTVSGGFALMRHVMDRLRLRLNHGVPWRLAAFLSTATDHGLLVATGKGYRFVHSTIRSAAEVALADRPADVPAPTRTHGPWASGYDRPDRLFAGVLDETVARRDIRRKLAARPDLGEEGLRESLTARRAAVLSQVSGHEEAYRAVLHHTRAADDADPTIRHYLPIALVWLLLGTSPLVRLVVRDGEPVGLLEGALSIGLVLALLIAPLWALGREGDEHSVAVPVIGVAYVLVAVLSLVFALFGILDSRFGRAAPDAFDGRYLVAAWLGTFCLPAAVAAVGYGIGRSLDRLRIGRRVNWPAAEAAFEEWTAALEHEVLTRAHALLDEEPPTEPTRRDDRRAGPGPPPGTY